jgi:hypothetical protein
MGGLVLRTLAHQVGDAWGLPVRVVVGHGVASIGRQLSKVQLGGLGAVGRVDRGGYGRP